MENRNIIIMLLVVIAILAVAVGVMMFNQSHAKEATEIKITSDKEQYEGGKLSVELKDLNGTALSKEVVTFKGSCQRHSNRQEGKGRG